MPIYSFEPIADDNCRLLILGTMPGVMSLRIQQYYGHERNAFWRIVYGLFSCVPDRDYGLRKLFLLEHNIALWDVLKACEREGSSDSEIRNPEPNDFASFYKKYPNIKYVCFNGGPARRLYHRYVYGKQAAGLDKEFFSLPSTSPAYTIPFKEKLRQWSIVRELLDGR